MNKLLSLSTLSCLTSMLLSSCIVESGDEIAEFSDEQDDLATSEQAIRGGQDVQAASKYDNSTVAVGGCTGTIIGPRHVISAIHCSSVGVGTVVGFYNGSQLTNLTSTVERVYAPWGVSATDLTDNDGKFADFIVLKLATEIPAGYVPAKLASVWPGSGVAMTQVGRGMHDGNPNPAGTLRYRITNSYSSSNAGGNVWVDAATNDGDSGGPLFTSWGSRLELHGVLYGSWWEWVWRGNYTSTAFHLRKIATAVGMTDHPNWNYWGNDISFTNDVSLEECVALCMANTSCNAYTLTTVVPGGTANPPFGRCYQKSGITSTGSAQSGRFSGTKGTSGLCTFADGLCRL